MIAPPAPDVLKAWLEFLTPIALSVLLVLRWFDRKMNKQTNEIVNGVHKAALQTILTQSQKILSLTAQPGDAMKVLEAQEAVDRHAGGRSRRRTDKKGRGK